MVSHGMAVPSDVRSLRPVFKVQVKIPWLF